MPLDGAHTPQRLAAVRRSGLLDSPPEAAFDRATSLAARATGAPTALVSIVTDTRQFFKSQVGLTGWAAAERGTPLDHSFCEHVVQREDVLRVTDATDDPVVAGNLAIESLGVRAYLGVPLRDEDGHVLGAVCCVDTTPRDWADEDVETLLDIASFLQAHLTLRATTRAMADEARSQRAHRGDSRRPGAPPHGAQCRSLPVPRWRRTRRDA